LQHEGGGGQRGRFYSVSSEAVWDGRRGKRGGSDIFGWQALFASSLATDGHRYGLVKSQVGLWRRVDIAFPSDGLESLPKVPDSNWSVFLRKVVKVRRLTSCMAGSASAREFGCIGFPMASAFVEPNVHTVIEVTGVLLVCLRFRPGADRTERSDGRTEMTPLLDWDGLQRLGAWNRHLCFGMDVEEARSNSVRRSISRFASVSSEGLVWKGEPWRGTKPKRATGGSQAATFGGSNGLICGVRPRG